MENISDEFISAGVDDSVLADLKNVSPAGVSFIPIHRVMRNYPLFCPVVAV